MLKTLMPALVLFAFLGGTAYGTLQGWPLPLLRETLWTMKAVLDGQQAGLEAPTILRQAPFKGEGVVISEPERMAPGLTMVQGMEGAGQVMRLVEADGTVVNAWKASFFDYWEEADHLEPPDLVPETAFSHILQGFHARPDGSLIIVFSHLGAVLVDRCSNPIWRLDELVHHSVTPDGQGGYLFPGHTRVSELDTDLLAHRDLTPLDHRIRTHERDRIGNLIIRVDADGRVTNRVPVLQAFLDAGYTGVVAHGLYRHRLDPLHINDVEAVTPALAARLPGVSAGDFLVSLRNSGSVAIIDTEGRLRWHASGRWVSQHDLDITADGQIEIFDNGYHQVPALRVFGSAVRRLNPSDGTTVKVTPVGDEPVFYTEFMGTHQALPNGNRLIADSLIGRILEVTPEDRIVWEYHLRWDERFGGLATAAERYPPDFFDVEDWSCQ
ncbi:MAG: arylsulfotransferase family protein [Pseudomonadota bacterium]